MMNWVKRALCRADCALLGAIALVAVSGASAREFILYTDELRALAALPDSVTVTHSSVALAIEQHATEAKCLAEAMYYEARGEGAEGEKAVAEVVLQRTADRDYPKTVCAVVYDGVLPARRDCQFSFACDGSLRRPKDRLAWNRLHIQADNILTGAVKLSGQTGRAIAYHSLNVAPAWAETMQKTAEIGNHIFYRRSPVSQVRLAQAAADALAQQQAALIDVLLPSPVLTVEAIAPLKEVQPEVEAPGAVGDGA